jgi:hypothetical protein
MFVSSGQIFSRYKFMNAFIMLHASKNLEFAGNQLDEGRHAQLLGMLDHMIARLTITTSSGTQTSDYTLFQMTTIGRAPGSTIVVDGAHALISRQHATIELLSSAASTLQSSCAMVTFMRSATTEVHPWRDCASGSTTWTRSPRCTKRDLLCPPSHPHPLARDLAEW